MSDDSHQRFSFAEKHMAETIERLQTRLKEAEERLTAIRPEVEMAAFRNQDIGEGAFWLGSTAALQFRDFGDWLAAFLRGAK